MNAEDMAVTRLRVEEGFRSQAYRDTTGHLTIGYGFNIDAGITQNAATALLMAQVEELADKLVVYPWYALLDPVRQSVLLDLAFNLGIAGLLSFVQMLLAVTDKNWQAAHDQLLMSRAATQAPARYQALASLLLTGTIQS